MQMTGSAHVPDQRSIPGNQHLVYTFEKSGKAAHNNMGADKASGLAQLQPYWSEYSVIFIGDDSGVSRWDIANFSCRY